MSIVVPNNLFSDIIEGKGEPKGEGGRSSGSQTPKYRFNHRNANNRVEKSRNLAKLGTYHNYVSRMHQVLDHCWFRDKFDLPGAQSIEKNTHQ